MSTTEDAEVQAAMRNVRGSWPAWLLLLVTIGVAGFGWLQLRSRAERAEAFAETTDEKLAERFAKIAVAETANVELKQRVTKLSAENAAMLPLKEAEAQAAQVLTAKNVVVAELAKQIEERLQKERAAKKLHVAQEAGALRLVLEESLLFADATATLSEPGAEALVVLGAAVATVPLERVDVVGHGHAGDDGPWPLSGARAGAVAAVLVDKARLSADSVRIIGHGPARPRAKGRSRSAAARNRRIELVVTPAAPTPETTPP